MGDGGIICLKRIMPPSPFLSPFLALFRRFNEKFGCAVLLVTHDERISNACDRVITLEDGRIVGGTKKWGTEELSV